MIEWLPVLLSNIVAATALALVATFVGWSGRHANLARWIWLAVFVKLVTPPVLDLPITLPASWTGQFSHVSTMLTSARISVPNLATRPAADRSEPANTVVVHESTDSESDRYASSSGGISVVALLMTVWWLGSAWLLVRGALRYLRMIRLLESQAERDEVGTQRVREMLGRGESEAVPQVRLIRARISPMLFGIGRQVSIVCPRELWLSLDEPQRLAFLAHETAHFVRRDHWVRWLEWLVTSLYWWLPLVYWARVQLERHEEVACDTAALILLQQQSQSPVRRSYAESLLSVVDFLSEAEPSSPRLASRMQPTAALEERLHWIMSSESNFTPRLPGLIGITMCGIVLLVHPTVAPWLPLDGVPNNVAVAKATSANSSSAEESNSRSTIENTLPGATPSDLPAAPRGWWNQSPEVIWANRELGAGKLRLLAQAGLGIGVSQPGGGSFTFDTRDVRGLAFVAGSGRLVVGRSNGELHLWDPSTARSVSLIGKHASAITSSCWSAIGGLVSCDQSGAIVRWDLQSGQIMASISCDQPTASVRWSSDGRQLGVLTGHWTQANEPRHLILYDGESLDQQSSRMLPHDMAAIHHDAQRGWLAIAWSGLVYEVASGEVIAAIPKNEVSGVVLCAELMPELKVE